MKIVILGGGSIGGSVANELSTEENDVIVIDNNQENLDSLSSKEGILTINGNASSPSTLKKANLDDDTLLLCLTDSEEVNLLASIVAKSKFNVGKVVCRLIGSDYEKISQDIASGVDYFINPENFFDKSESLLSCKLFFPSAACFPAVCLPSSQNNSSSFNCFLRISNSSEFNSCRVK